MGLLLISRALFVWLSFGTTSPFVDCILISSTLCLMRSVVRPWMPFLNQKITKAMRLEIKRRADAQNKEIVVKSVSKSSGKRSVPLVLYIIISK